ncbi:uncharacterized protein LOC130915065 isoform X4 [Corythoichthys intestinalis]|uniref:uncharacterized protein LOC130915065 isoform X4 n=1 Tax=Corythoichthys intestinalis TaxID=161448 RepID=UPI0025A63153|nr:uncharacterized protein LOC130915065 isoform X4 [Corythoichthys intestinalis]
MRYPADVTMKELHPQKPDPLHVKQEESEMPYIKQEAEPETPRIKEEQEEEISKFPMTVIVKNEEDEGPSEESGVAKPSGDCAFQHPTTKGEGRSQPDDVTVEDLHLEKHDPLHVKNEDSEMLYIKQRAEPETPNIKEEKQENEIPKFPMTVIVMSDEDEAPCEESRAAKLGSSNLFQRLTTKDIIVEDRHPEKHNPPHVKQERESVMQCIKKETPIIKEEHDDEITIFPLTVIVKSEEDGGPSEKQRRDVVFDQKCSKSLNQSSLKRETKEYAVSRRRHYERASPSEARSPPHETGGGGDAVHQTGGRARDPH